MEDYKKKYENLHRFVIDLYPHMSDYCKQKTEGMIPELKESEDERIRKEIICVLKGEISYTSKEENEKYIAWVEKQGEQKSNDISPIFRVGDYIRNKKTSDKVLIEQLDIATKAYYYVSYDGAAVNHSDLSFSKQDEWELIGQKVVEQNHTDKIEPKFKVGDYIINGHGFIMQIDGIDGNAYVYHVLDDDTFIEKACFWLKENKDKYLYNTGEKGEYIPTCSGKMIEDFEKYMKGE